MNYRVVLPSLALVVFGVGVIVLTVFYNATSGFTEAATFYTSSTSIYTVGFRQGLQVVAVGVSSSTITSQGLSGLTFYITQVSTGFIPFQNWSWDLVYVFGLALCIIAVAIPLQRVSKSKAGEVNRPRKIEANVKFCIECGAKLPPDAKFCNKCGSPN